VVRLGFIIGFIALIGVLLSGLAAYRVHDQELTIDGIALARAIDVHASLVQDRLTERELLARVAAGLFRTPSVVKASMLEPLRSSMSRAANSRAPDFPIRPSAITMTRRWIRRRSASRSMC
jgi:hypothetical protein